ncbi:hypothetical protein GCM10010400_02210 [Streptomyces aculeolatus]|uniref:hypothetical protein n=1 Tax=Streptomyces aculeolatus TaxID=270689 RepID=UPI00056B60AD|nr:hypothetical protein [Streptomyces aculeolatus]
MPNLLSTRRTAAVSIAGAALALAAAGPAAAGDGTGQGGSDQIGSRVEFSASSPGSGETSPMTPIGGSWSPPVCWYEPRYTPDQMDDYVHETYNAEHNATSAISELVTDDSTFDLRKDKEGLWWELVYQNDGVTAEACPATKSFMFVGPEEPAEPNTDVIDPETLAALAYNETKLPAPPVDLKPNPDRQVVNLETHAVLDPAQLQRVWVTAYIDPPGTGRIAATTVATPQRLRLEAGTEFAEPNVCEYDLVRKGGGFAVDTEDAGCNITYRKSSGEDTYELEASLTWSVAWNPTESPDGTPVHEDFPDGQSTTEIPVTVKEIQTVVR